MMIQKLALGIYAVFSGINFVNADLVYKDLHYLLQVM